jgi:hypothetical protein
MLYGFCEVSHFCGYWLQHVRRRDSSTEKFVLRDYFFEIFAFHRNFGSGDTESRKSRLVLAICFQTYSNRCSTVIRNRESKVRK